MGLLSGKRIVVTGVLTDASLAFGVAKLAQEEGAEVVLTGAGRGLSLTERTARKLPTPPPVFELDVSDPSHVAAVRERVAAEWDRVDGVLHSIGYAPPACLGGGFLEAGWEDVAVALNVSAYSLKVLVDAFLPLMTDGGAIVGLTFDATVAWPAYDWMGVAKAALESVNRYLARDLGSSGVRSNLVSAGPIRTTAARSIPGFGERADRWEHGAPLGWDPRDPSVVADVCLFLLSPLSRAITGEIVHVDGGYHAVGAPGASTRPATTAPTEPEPTP